MGKSKNKNYLDFIPIKNQNLNWHLDSNNLVVLVVERKGVFDKFAQKVFKVPPKSNIKLDKYGSFTWECINDSKSVYEISEDIHNKFGSNADPLLDRLVAFLNILNDNKFISFNKRGN